MTDISGVNMLRSDILISYNPEEEVGNVRTHTTERQYTFYKCIENWYI